MPTYEYECTNDSCKYVWELEQKITEDRIKICPRCQKETAKRLIAGSTSFVLQGGGWAKEGYK